MGGVQGLGRVLTHIVPCAVSKADSNHGSGYYSHRTLGLASAGTIGHRSLGQYPIPRGGGAQYPHSLTTWVRISVLKMRN